MLGEKLRFEWRAKIGSAPSLYGSQSGGERIDTTNRRIALDDKHVVRGGNQLDFRNDQGQLARPD